MPTSQDGKALPPSVQQLLELAAQQQNAGDLAGAERSYHAVVAQQPDHAAALAGIGALAGQRGDAAVAARHLARACELEPQVAIFQHNHGEALRQLGQLPAAEAALRRAVDLDPALVPAWSSLIAVLQAAHGHAVQARDAHRAAMLAHDLARMFNNQGNALLARGALPDATACYRQALAIRSEYAVAWSNLGNSLRQLGQISEAESTCRRAIALDAKFAPAWNNLGNALVDLGRYDEAPACYDQALALQPDFPEALHNRGSGSLFNTLFAPGMRDADVLAAHQAWGSGYPAPRGRQWRNTLASDRILRVGYLSPDFREHAMRHFLEPLLAQHQASQVGVVCYAQGPGADAHTRRLMDYGHRWTWVHGLSDEALAAQIEADAIDILVDCAGHTQGTRLAALAGKPAPLMMAWLGYLNASGLPAMDYRLTDDWVDPPGSTQVADTEVPLRVPGGMLAYRAHTQAPAVNGLPCLERGCVTFGSLNKIQKLNRVIVADWAQLLASVPGSRLILQSKQLSDAGVAGRMRGLFEAFGIASARLDLRPASADFLRTYHEIDVALDTFPYGGGATTCDALWMGVPVVTRSGTRAAGRLSTSILHQVGRPEWIAATPNGYIVTAIELARKTKALARIRDGLRAQMQSSPLCDEVGFVRRLEAVYRAAWKKWVAQQ